MENENLDYLMIIETLKTKIKQLEKQLEKRLNKPKSSKIKPKFPKGIVKFDDDDDHIIEF